MMTRKTPIESASDKLAEAERLIKDAQDDLRDVPNAQPIPRRLDAALAELENARDGLDFLGQD